MQLAQSLACASCFSHRSLRRFIEENGATIPCCQHCGRKNVPAVDVRELTPFFQAFMELFEEYPDGVDTLMYHLDGYRVFNSFRLPEAARSALFEDIVNSNFDDDDADPPVRATDYYRHRPSLYSQWQDYQWAVHDDPGSAPDFSIEFADAIMNQARFLSERTKLFRARIGCESGPGSHVRPYQGKAIGAPPSTSKNGRAHRIGQRVLYAALEKPTAVAEMRPVRGHYVSVGILETRRRTRILDLANIGGVDPFIGKFAGMAANEGWTFGAVAAAMAEPQRFEDDDIVYRPCQMFAEFAKSCGCDGISYPSALARGGTNVVFFDPDIAEIKSSQLVQITAVRYWHRDMPTLPPDSSSSAVEDSGQST